ncbi:MAG: GGDEF domain-containing protein [Candidatus Rokubacteria bacterium]|nr:GGDEF domain-containing protein [Candidatus Rokubacteria bacterium]
MPEEGSPDTQLAARRLRQRILLALIVSSVLPLLVLAYVTHSYVLPNLRPTDTARVFGLPTLVFFTMLAVVVGAWVIRDLGRVLARMAELMARRVSPDKLESGGDAVGTLMQSFTKVLGTIEHQTTEINSFATRLDAAYKELERTNAKLKEFSFKDEVTGLYNRRFFGIRLEEEISRFRRFNHPVSVVLLDLDGFKSVNDEFGHAVGDETLRDIAQILVKHSRGINVVSRYGGDEFAVLLVETSKAGARLYADRIRQVVSTYPFAHGKRLTASFGVASLPDDEAVTAEDLFRLADDALYAAKRAGKNQVAVAAPAEKVD